jgi:hypothetical protein
MFPLQPLSLLRPSTPSTVLCPLYHRLSPLPPSILSTALCFLNSLLFLYGPLSLLLPSVLSTVLCLLYSHLFPHHPPMYPLPFAPLYDTLYPLWSSVPSTTLHYVPPTVLYPLYGTLSLLRPFISSMAKCLLYGPLPPLRGSTLCPSTAPCPYTAQPCVLSSTLSPLFSPLSLYGPIFPLRPSFLSTASAPSTALCTLHDPLLSLWPSVSSTALCSLYGPLYPPRPSIISMALCFLNSPLSPLRLSVPLYDTLYDTDLLLVQPTRACLYDLYVRVQ